MIMIVWAEICGYGETVHRAFGPCTHLRIQDIATEKYKPNTYGEHLMAVLVKSFSQRAVTLIFCCYPYVT